MGQALGNLNLFGRKTVDAATATSPVDQKNAKTAAPVGVSSTTSTLASAAPVATTEAKAGLISRIFSAIVSIPVAIFKAVFFIPMKIVQGIAYVVQTPKRNADAKAKAAAEKAAADLAKAAEEKATADRAAYLKTWKGWFLNLFGKA